MSFARREGDSLSVWGRKVHCNGRCICTESIPKMSDMCAGMVCELQEHAAIPSDTVKSGKHFFVVAGHHVAVRIERLFNIFVP